MLEIEQGLLYSFMMAVMLGAIWGLRKMFVLEKSIFKIDQNMQKILERMEKQEAEVAKRIQKK